MYPETFTLLSAKEAWKSDSVPQRALSMQHRLLRVCMLVLRRVLQNPESLNTSHTIDLHFLCDWSSFVLGPPPYTPMETLHEPGFPMIFRYTCFDFSPLSSPLLYMRPFPNVPFTLRFFGSRAGRTVGEPLTAYPFILNTKS